MCEILLFVFQNFCLSLCVQHLKHATSFIIRHKTFLSVCVLFFFFQFCKCTWYLVLGTLVLVYIWRSFQVLIGSLVFNKCMHSATVGWQIGFASEQGFILVALATYLCKWNAKRKNKKRMQSRQMLNVIQGTAQKQTPFSLHVAQVVVVVVIVVVGVRK